MWEDYKTNWYAISTIWVIMILNFSFFSSFSLPINNNITHINNHTYLDDYLYNYSFKSLPKRPHTGVVYNISLPANFSSMKVSVLRLRSSTLWGKGANISNFDIPPKIVTMPYVKRLAIMYENLGNLSSRYYELPGYTFLTKVIGFAVYNASKFSEGTMGWSKRLNVTLGGEQIKVMFSQTEILYQGRNNDSEVNKLKMCVRFDPQSGSVELSDMLRPNVCMSQGVGHFVIAMPKVNGSVVLSPSPSPSPSPSRVVPSSLGIKRIRMKITAVWVWWVVGITAGLVGLMLCYVLGYKIYVSQKIKKMESLSEKSESLDTKWIGNSKFPLAPVTRTQAVIENQLAP